MRVFGRRLFERSEFPAAAQDLFKIGDEAAGGSLLFGYFFLATQEKVARQPGETGKGQSNNLH
jgi:hypothetical protein